MKTKDLYCGRLDLFRSLWCTVSAHWKIQRIQKTISWEIVILLLDVCVLWDYVDHLRIKAKTEKLPWEILHFTWTVAMYDRNRKVGIKNITLQSI